MQQIQFANQLISPGKIVCIGRNYVEHIAELGNEVAEQMVVFIKPNSAITTQLHASHQGEPLHYEGEICLLMDEQGVAGVGFGLDLTKRALQSQLKQQGLPWERAKGFDGAALFSGFVPFRGALEQLSLRLTINNQQRQQGGVSLMIYPPATILTELQRFLTLNAGDIVMTGTPAGVGQINPGDTFVGQLYAGQQLLVEQYWRAG